MFFDNSSNHKYTKIYFCIIFVSSLRTYLVFWWLFIKLTPLSCCHISSRLIHGGQLLNGLAGPTIMSAGPYLSTTWFAPDQRATATAVASLFCTLGGSASFIVGPLVVPAPNDTLAAAAVAAVTDSSIRDRIQLVMYTGTDSQRGAQGGGQRESISHHFDIMSPLFGGNKYNQAGDPTGSHKQQKKKKNPFCGTDLLKWFKN